jgi:predicted N-formylglutamate amidohydrolase
MAFGDGTGTLPAAVHVGVHTFTPVWRHRRRATDIGILYDPRRGPEAGVARLWRDGLASALRGESSAAGALNIHLNRPYRGWTDGLTTSLRTEFPPARYLGLELEVSQALVPVDSRIVTHLADSFLEAVHRVPLG